MSRDNDDEKDKKGLSEESKKVLSKLTDREKYVLKMKFGVNLDNESQDEIAKQFDDTRKRIREIEAKALKKLRNKGGNDPDAA